jgi:hypothetical protein
MKTTTASLVFRRVALGVGLVPALIVAACSDSPITPTPPPPTPPAVVTPPTISAVSTAVTRTEVETDVTITAEVQDAERAPDTLTYVWSATAGTITGSGRTVTWRLPRGAAPTPADIVVTVTAVEPYQALENNQLVNREHRVSRQSQPMRVHDSTAELSAMTLRFLLQLFGNSAVSPDACLVDFSTNRSLCPTGRDAERVDIVNNRAEYVEIYDAQARIETIEFNGARTFAWIEAPCLFRSRKRNGSLEGFAGNCELTAVYDQGRWWLCESYFRNSVPIPTSGAWPLRRTFGQREPEPGTFPFYFR